MPDKKLTDSEIIKALECLEKDTNCGDCAVKKKCEGDCVFSKSIDLINRLQAENERLKNAYKQCAWERDNFQEDLNDAKAEAYKEFAEKAIKLIRAKAFNLQLMRSLYTSQSAKALNKVADDINNLLKELVGEDNESKNK